MVTATDPSAKKASLEELISEIESDLDHTPNDPMLWALRGLAYRNLISVFQRSKDDSMTTEEYFSHPRFKKNHRESTRSYVKAFRLITNNEDKNIPEDVVSVIMRDVNLDPRVKEAAARYNIKKMGGASEKYYRNMYQSVLESYWDSERFEDALRILDEMEKKFPDMRKDYAEYRRKIKSDREKVNKE